MGTGASKTVVSGRLLMEGKVSQITLDKLVGLLVVLRSLLMLVVIVVIVVIRVVILVVSVVNSLVRLGVKPW